MSTTYLPTHISHCLLGVGRCDITPPVGIYHRLWGAAAHDRATGVHRPLTATVVVMQPLHQQAGPDDRSGQVLIALDHCRFSSDDLRQLRQETGRMVDVDPADIIVAFSHTHAAGNLSRSRNHLPGGEQIGTYLDGLPWKLAKACRTAHESLQLTDLAYAEAPCSMGANRDYRDDRGRYLCGFNPDVEVSLKVQVVRTTDAQGRLMATLVTYPCEPATLGWENTLISPDYVGALRETVERETDAPCVFLTGPCGDVGPRYGFVDDVQAADRNGRQAGHAALQALESLPPRIADYHFAGPVLSGATLGVWEYRPPAADRRNRATFFRERRWDVTLPYRDDLPNLEETETELNRLFNEELDARQRGDAEKFQEARALAERKRRMLERLKQLPPDKQYPFPLHVWQMGDAFWVAVEGAPYHALQEELNHRFPRNPILVVAFANGDRGGCLPTREAGKKRTDTAEAALLAPGCLEKITREVAGQIEAWLAD